METNFIAKARITINTGTDKVWKGLTNPEMIRKYMFGTSVISDWKEGSEITWKGEWQGKTYEDKGKILEFVPGKKLKYTHFSPLSGQPDREESYHTVSVDLIDKGTSTDVSLTQDKNATEQEKEQSEKNWQMMLNGLKQVLESQ